MKKTLMFLFLSFGMVSCYEDYIKDFDYSGIYFPYQTNVRTFVVGEGMKINVGAALGGVMENKHDRQVNYKFDNQLVTPQILTAMQNGLSYIKESVAGVEKLEAMPADYFTVSNASLMIIPKGYHGGTVEIKADSAKFLADPATLKATYALPFYITSADADSVIEPKRYSVIGLKYENKLFGNYWHGGVRTIKDASGKVINEIKYQTVIPSLESKVWTLRTVAPFSLETNGLADDSDNGSIKLTLKPDGSIDISQSSSSKVAVSGDGVSSFNQSKLLQNRKLFLNYKFDNGDGTMSFVRDTLTFRNRIRDGVNEWQDENASNYE